MKTRLSIAVYAHNLNNCEIKARKNSGLKWIRTHDLSIPVQSGGSSTELSYQAN